MIDNRDIRRLKETRCFLLDLDGTIFLSDRLLPGAQEFIHFLDTSGIAYIFLSNNSSRTRKEYAEKLGRLGLVQAEEKFFISSEATALYLKKQKPGARLYVVGTPALVDEFVRFGFVLDERRPDFAVLGFDTSLTYAKLQRLCELLAAGTPYIATHADVNCPTEGGFMPDVGAMIEMIAASTGRRPDVVVGKPNAPIVQALQERLDVPIQRMCMVGDRLYTDIALGQAGLATVLVLSGETRPGDLPGSPYQPDYVVDDLAGLLDRKSVV
jgi:HAD superfamily hydrolase (TIGR01450 family)